MAITKFDLRQSVLRPAQPMIGSAANDTADTLFPKIDAELSKLFEDRNILLTDGGTITFTGTQLQFTENLNIVLNSKVSGAAPQIISLGSANVNLSASGQIWYAVIDRSAGTATASVATSLPAVTSANQEVFLLAKRVDAGDGTQRVYWRSGMAMNAGQSVRLGASGSGSGNGTGDDLDALLFRASFTDVFAENATNANSGINSSGTNASYNAAKTMYVMSYDASKTITTSGTAVTASAAPAFTVAVGDVVYLQSTNEVKKITAVASQTSYTLESAFAANQTAAAATISQAVYTKDIYNLAVDGSAISAAFGSSAFSEIMVDYKDGATVGSNIFAPNVAPVVAFVASPDNSSWTTAQSRPTNETDTAYSTFLPAAGTSLYFRFFSKQSSGSGTVNLINYKAFMQKSVVASAGGVLNSAYCFTNSVGTPVNCSTSVVGGKTQIKLGFSYPVGVNAGMPYGSLDIYVNGQLIPRFINSTLTPDAAYAEVSGSVIQLDHDYSSQNLSVEILQRVQVIDNSTINTTAIAAIQEASSMGFQGFVNTNNVLNATTTAGSPAAGSFYSTVVNRAALVDFTQDLKARMGIERVMVQSIYQLQSELGPNGEPVWAALNDDRGMIRFVGSQWATATDTQGVSIDTAGTSLTDYVEIIFYGTGLNLLTLLFNSSQDYRVSVDGGAEGSNILGASYSSVLTGRYYSPNQVLPIVSGLALGVHTVKIRKNVSGVDFRVYGFEILNESAQVKVQPGISYLAGSKLVSSSQTAFAYNAPVTGNTGGRVLVYQNADGTIKTAFTANATSPSYLTSASHNNEEMVRQYSPREFGAGTNGDFSIVSNASNSYVAFTLDDGTTTLAATNALFFTYSGYNGVYNNANSSYITFIFVGTGLDLFLTDSNAGGNDTFTFQIDGGTAQAWPNTAGIASPRTMKIVSGLPYGTHTFKLNRVTAATWTPVILGFKTYQPKKPSLPSASGAVELADYNVMANYIPLASISNEVIMSQGVLAKASMREATYVGTWSVVQPGAITKEGYITGTATAGSYVQYTFFGTGFDFRFTKNSAAMSFQVSVDGSTNLSGYSTSLVYGGSGLTFTPSTGTLSGTATTSESGNTISVYGLPLGLHTVKVAWISGSNLYAESFDIITPIHSTKSNAYADLQNTLSVGSCAIADNRKTSAIKDSLPATKAWAQAFGITVTPSTTSTSPVPVPDMSVIIKTNGGALDISYSLLTGNSNPGQDTIAQIYVDGMAVGQYKYFDEATANYAYEISDRLVVPVSAGIHKVDLYYWVSGGTGRASDRTRTLIAKEI